jgi:hypothetical protein
MENTFNHEKFQKILRITMLVINIFIIFLTVVAGVLVIGLAVSTFLPQDLFVFDLSNLNDVNFEVYNVTLNISSLDLTGEVTIKSLVLIGLLFAFINIIWMNVIVRYLKRFMKDVKAKNPFNENNIKRLKTIAYLFIGGGIVLPVFSSLFSLQVMNIITQLDLSVNFSLNLTYIFIGLLILVLGYVFEYGTYLQEEYNETV